MGTRLPQGLMTKFIPGFHPLGGALGVTYIIHSITVCACVHARARSHPAGCEDLGLHTSSLAPSRCLAPWLNRRALVYQAPTVC